MNDNTRWAESTEDQLRDIAKSWAKKMTTKQLRGFQNWYNKLFLQTEDEVTAKSLNNRWQVATWAIDIREFGE